MIVKKSLMNIWNAFLLVIALSLDNFLASLAYGGEHIRIPRKSAVLISLIGVLFLSFSLYTAAFIQQFIPPYVYHMISFTIPFMIGLDSLFQGTIRPFLGAYKRKKLGFEHNGISFVLDIYLDKTEANADNSKLLSLKKALRLAAALSIDSLAGGFALNISIVQPLPVLVINFYVSILAILGGSFLGSRVLSLKECGLSWVSGVLLLILASPRMLRIHVCSGYVFFGSYCFMRTTSVPGLHQLPFLLHARQVPVSGTYWKVSF